MCAYELRPHHALCMRFFTGHGYSAEFTANMRAVISALERGAEVRICTGPDAICARCPNMQAGRCTSDGKVARYDAAVMALCGLRAGDVTTLDELHAAVERGVLRNGRLGEVCGDCEWSALCQSSPLAAQG